MSKEFVDIMRNSVMGGNFHSGRRAGSRQQGTMIGIVTNNVDPEDRYRIKVKYPWSDDDLESFWARIGSGMASTEFGSFFLPEVDDEVIVSFMDGDPERPFIVGGAYNGKNKAPAKVTVSPDDVDEDMSNNAQGGKNDFRGIISRNKSHLIFKDRDGEGAISLRTTKSACLYLDDKDGSEKVQLYDHKREQWLEIDVAAKKITLQTDTGDILIKAKKTITLECKDLVIKADKTIKVDSGTSSEWKAGSTVKWESGGTSDFKAGGTMTSKAPKIDLNP